ATTTRRRTCSWSRRSSEPRSRVYTPGMAGLLGISAFYHDSAAALLRDGELVGAAQEERFTRRKFDRRFPVNAIRYCLAEGGIRLHELDAVVFYEKPARKLERVVSDFLAVAPKGEEQFLAASA